MTKIQKIKDKLTKKDAQIIAILNHPRKQKLKYYQYRVGLRRIPDIREIIWLNSNVTGNYSIDFTTPPHNLSFEVRADAVRFKLTFGGDLACKAHQKL